MKNKTLCPHYGSKRTMNFLILMFTNKQVYTVCRQYQHNFVYSYTHCV